MSNFIQLQNTIEDCSNRKIRNMVDRGELTSLLHEFYPESLARYCSEDTEEWSKSATLRNMIQLIKLGHQSNFSCEYEHCDNLIHNMAKKNKGEFAKFCSPGCIANAKLKSKDVKDKIKKTNLEKYGCEHPLGSKEVQDSIKKSNLAKYGVECAAGLPEVQAKREQTVRDRYGVSNVFELEDVKEKSKATNLEKYGNEHAPASKSIKEKIKKTLKANYGSESLMGSPEIRKRADATIKVRFGVDNVMQNEEVYEKMVNTLRKKYGHSNLRHVQELVDKASKTKMDKTAEMYKEHLKDINMELLEEYVGTSSLDKDLPEDMTDHTNLVKYLFLCKDCSTEFRHNMQKMPKCPECSANLGSLEEQKWRKYIEDLGFKTSKMSFPALGGLTRTHEIDIFIPSLNVGFEYNGVYWHSEQFKDNEYHANKTKGALEQGINLYHIWSSDSDESIKQGIMEAVGISEINVSSLSEEVVYLNRDDNPDPMKSRLLEKGYEFVEDLGPQEMYTDGKDLFGEYSEKACLRVFNSGILKYQKK